MRAVTIRLLGRATTSTKRHWLVGGRDSTVGRFDHDTLAEVRTTRLALDLASRCLLLWRLNLWSSQCRGRWRHTHRWRLPRLSGWRVSKWAAASASVASPWPHGERRGVPCSDRFRLHRVLSCWGYATRVGAPGDSGDAGCVGAGKVCGWGSLGPCATCGSFGFPVTEKSASGTRPNIKAATELPTNGAKNCPGNVLAAAAAKPPIASTLASGCCINLSAAGTPVEIGAWPRRWQEKRPLVTWQSRWPCARSHQRSWQALDSELAWPVESLAEAVVPRREMVMDGTKAVVVPAVG